ncbi:MAG: hypothetical protein PVG19_11375, partial [Desulfobacterales bacterium]
MLKPDGSKVRCSRCKHIWRAYPPETVVAEPEGPTANDGPPDKTAIAAGALAAGAAVTAALSADDQTSAEATATAPAPDVEAGPPELKLGFDEPPAPEPTSDVAEDDQVPDEVNLDELDLLLEDDPVPSGPAAEDDFKTEELNLADLEKMLESETSDIPFAEPPPAAPAVEEMDAETDESIIEELDLDMDNLENLLEEDSDLGAGIESPLVADTPDDEIKLDLSSELDDLLADGSPDPGVEETEDIDLPEMDEALEEEADATPADLGADDDDLNLELAPGLDSLFDEVEDKDVPLEETEDLDLTALEDELGKQDQAAEEAADTVDAPDASPVAADDDLEMTLSLDDDGEPPALSDDGEATLDLGDLEDALAGDGVDAAKVSPGEEQPELVMELDGRPDEPADLGDMNLALDDLDLESADQLQDGDIEETRELDLEDLEGLLDDGEAPSAEASTPEVEDLELDLDFDEAPVDDDDAMDDATRELNLDDIEKILESQDAETAAPPAEAAADDDLDLDLDFGDDGEDAPALDAPVAATDEAAPDSDALDLTELEKMLDVEDTTDSPALPADEEVDDLDLDFDLQPATDEGEELDLEFDMLEDDAEAPSALFDTSESEDLGLEMDLGETPEPEKAQGEEDLDFKIMGEDGGEELDLDILDEESEDFDLDILEEQNDDLDLDLLGEETAPDTTTEPIAAAAAATAAGAAGAAASRDLTQELMDEMAAADTQTMEIPPTDSKPIKPPPAPKKRKSSKSLVFVLILALLGGGGYFAYTKTGFDPSKFNLSILREIPFVGQWLGGQKAPEAVVPVEATLKGSWVQNQTDGRLYIIQGRVKNEYSQPRSYIRVTGRIFADGRQFKRAAQAYCGNMPS